MSSEAHTPDDEQGNGSADMASVDLAIELAAENSMSRDFEASSKASEEEEDDEKQGE